MTDFKVGDWVQGTGYWSGVLRKGQVTDVQEDLYEIQDLSTRGSRSINKDETFGLTFRDGDAEPPEGIDVLVEQDRGIWPFLVRSGDGWEWTGSPDEPTTPEYAEPWSEVISAANGVCEVYGGEDQASDKVRFKVGDRVQHNGADWSEMAGATGVVLRTDLDGNPWVRLDEDRDFVRAGKEAFWYAEHTTLLGREDRGIGCWAPVGVLDSDQFIDLPTPMLTERSAVLTEADDLINGARNEDYGTPRDNLGRTAALWNVQLGDKLNEPLTAQDVALLMIHVKMARVINRGNRDNFVDIAGYAAIAWETRDDE